jgi:hypothetical protein
MDSLYDAAVAVARKLAIGGGLAGKTRDFVQFVSQF